MLYIVSEADLRNASLLIFKEGKPYLKASYGEDIFLISLDRLLIPYKNNKGEK